MFGVDQQFTVQPALVRFDIRTGKTTRPGGRDLEWLFSAGEKDAETLALVEQINLARAEKYQEVAQKPYLNRECRQIGGAELVNRAAEGEYVRGINGQWMKR